MSNDQAFHQLTIDKDIQSGGIKLTDTSNQVLKIDSATHAEVTCHKHGVSFEGTAEVARAYALIHQAIADSKLNAPQTDALQSYVKNPTGISVTVNTGTESVMDHICAPNTPAVATSVKLER